MIAKITHGWRPAGLLRYLMGPGRHNEHLNPRALDTWDGIPTHQPAQIGPREYDLRDLVAGLTDPAVAAGIALHEPAPGANGKTWRQLRLGGKAYVIGNSRVTTPGPISEPLFGDI